jgi:L-threonylcarbamoyladenylate synthase
MAAPLMMAPWTYSGCAMGRTTELLPFSDDAIAEAARLVLAGEPVAVPTETVYGLAADATNAEAVARIYAAKGRPSFNPLIVHVRDLESARRIGRFDEQALELANAHWPGPLTLVMPLRDDGGIASIVTAGLATIALRVPAHPAMRAAARSPHRRPTPAARSAQRVPAMSWPRSAAVSRW